MSNKEKKKCDFKQEQKQKVMKLRQHVAVDCSTLELRQLGRLDHHTSKQWPNNSLYKDKPN